MNAILQSAFLKALGWSLINSLWQMGIVWLLYQILTRNGTKFSAEKRHNLALLSQFTGSLWFIVTFIINLTMATEGASVAGSNAASGIGSAISLAVEPLLPWLSLIYLVVTVLLLFRLSSHLSSTRTLASKGLTKADPEIRVFMQQLAAQMGIKKPIRVWISNLVETPLTIGFWRPVILLPVAIVNNLSLKQTESIILHELYHIQRNDFLINLLIAVADIILFFNPFAKYFREVIQREREHRCDDMVLQFRYDPMLYAQALLILEQHRPTRHSVMLAATGNNKFFLLARVKRLVTGETVAVPVSKRMIAFLMSTLVLAYIGWNNSGNVSAEVVINSNAPQIVEMKAAGSLEAQPQYQYTPVPVAGITDKTFDSPEKSSSALPMVAAESNVEKNLARVIVSEKIEELITSVAHDRMIEYVKSEVAPEFTISIDRSPAQTETSDTTYPFVPSSSFLYNVTGDTALPKKLSESEIKSKLQLVSALKSIDEMNWSDIGRNLAKAGENLDISRLHLELKKAVTEVDWKTLNKDLENSAKESATEIEKYKSQLADRYLQYNKAKLDRAEKARTAEVQIVQERLKTPRKIKKIVTI
ncbi:MAG TPA: M56 family metallopeptidase [Flavitalea sp.]|nr:M56 family metallopeptidase [Flavitalea sp.]